VLVGSVEFVEFVGPGGLVGRGRLVEFRNLSSETAQGCYKGVTRVCYKGVTRVLQGCYKSVTRVSKVLPAATAE
jgi:hypothetical protein